MEHSIHSSISDSDSASKASPIKPIHRTLILVFVIFLWLPLLGTFFKWDFVQSQSEKRRFSALPPFPGTANALTRFPDAFTAYFNDHFGFRNTFVRLNALFSAHILNVSPNDKVQFGKNGWLYFTDTISQDYYQNLVPFTEAELDVWVAHVREARSKAAKLGARYYFVIAPNSVTIYGDEIFTRPPTTLHALSRREQLRQKLAEEKITWVDQTDALLSEKDNFRLFHKTDTHWNDVGAYFGYRALMNAIEADYPDLKARPFSDFRVDTRLETGGDLADMLGQSDLILENAIHLVSQTERKAKLELEAAGAIIRHQSICDECGNRSAVVFHDSFFKEGLMPLFGEHFSRIKYSTTGLDWELIERERPHVIVEELVERRLMNYTP